MDNVENTYLLFLQMVKMINETIDNKKKQKKKYSNFTRLLTNTERILEFYEELIYQDSIDGGSET